MIITAFALCVGIYDVEARRLKEQSARQPAVQFLRA
jgi:hypothetical protein